MYLLVVGGLIYVTFMSKKHKEKLRAQGKCTDL